MNFILVLFFISVINFSRCFSSSVCTGRGESCLTAPEACCDELTCDRNHWTCEEASPYTSPQCQLLNQYCGYGENCCTGLKCSSGRCESNPTPSPGTPCIQKGLNCVASAQGCCNGLHCVGYDGDWSCQPKTPPTPSPSPGCKLEHQSCGYDENCCTGLKCSSGRCESHPTPTPGTPCIQKGLNCEASPNGCCKGLDCVGNDGDWSCQPKIPPTPPTPPPSPGCQIEHQSCGLTEECCSGLTCSGVWSGTCEGSPTPSPGPPCIQRGQDCQTSPNGCCKGLHCVGNDGDWSCQPKTPPTPSPSPGCKLEHQSCGYGENCCSGLTCSDEGRCEAAPTPTPALPCFQQGISCMTAPEACCSGLKCVDNENGLTCEPDTPPTPSPSPGCHRKHSSCDSDEDCCSGLTCSSGSCESIPTPTPSQPCIQKGLNCVTALEGCCSGLSCVNVASGWTCLPDTPPSPTPPPSCRHKHNACNSEHHCCRGLTCSYGTCISSPTPQPSPCLGKGASCMTTPHGCCSGLRCNPNSWQCVPDTPATTTPTTPYTPTPYPGCQSINTPCDSENHCCSGLTCSDDGMCKSSPTPQPSPCKGEGVSCVSAPYGCCKGLRCDGDSWLCVSDTPETTTPYWTIHHQCNSENRQCGMNQNCCAGLTCTDGTCKSSSPCTGKGANCYTSPEGCCSGLVCDKNSWLCEQRRPITTTYLPPTIRTTTYKPPTTTTNEPSTTTASCIKVGDGCTVGETPCCPGTECTSYVWSFSTYCS